MNKPTNDNTYLGKALITLGVISLIMAAILIVIPDASMLIAVIKGLVPASVLAGIVFPMIGALILKTANNKYKR